VPPAATGGEMNSKTVSRMSAVIMRMQLPCVGVFASDRSNYIYLELRSTANEASRAV